MNTRQATFLSGSTMINAPKSEVWSIVKEIGDIDQFHPLVRESYKTNDVIGIGSRRHCKLKPMGEMEEEIISWSDGKGFTMQVVGGRMLPPADFMHGELELRKRGSRTEVTFTFSYRIKFGLLGAILNAVMIKPQCKNAPAKYVDGLKVYVEKHKDRDKTENNSVKISV